MVGVTCFNKVCGYGGSPAVDMRRVPPVTCILLGHGTGRESFRIGFKAASKRGVPSRVDLRYRRGDLLDRRNIPLSGGVIEGAATH